MGAVSRLLHRVGWLTLLLLGVDFLDELSSGVPTVGAPDLQGAYGLSYTAASLAIFVAPLAVSMLLEPPLFVLADRYPRKPFVLGGLLVLAACQITCGLAPGAAVLVAALALSAAAGGCGVTLSQATLMDADPERRERLMARWAFLGMLGDLAAPALFALLPLFGWGWRQAFLVSGAVLALYALALARQPFPARCREAPASSGGGGREAEGDPRPSIPAALRLALGNRRLLLWLLGVWLCGLLDEILVAFGALFLRVHLGAGVAARSAVLMAFVAGGMAGLLAVDRLLARVEPLRLLRAAAIGCALAYPAWLLAPSLPLSGALMLLVGFFAAPLYPIAKARAYRALPGHSATVNALAHLFGPATLALPFALGLLADRLGLAAALLLLVAQPVGLLLIARRQEG